MSMEIAQRLDRIDAHMAHLERLVEQLNEVVIGQDRTIEQLRKQLTRQAGTLESIELERIKRTNPKPPHYE